MPRPTRRAAFFEPSAGLMVLSRISTLALHKVRNLVDHAAHLRRVLQLDRVVELAQPEAADGRTVRLLRTDHALDQRDLDLLVGHRLPQNLFDGLAALGSNLRRRADREQTVDGRAHDVVRVGRTDALADHVGHAHHLEHRTHRAAGDDAGTARRGLHQHAGRAVVADHRVLEGAVAQGNLGHLAARFVHRLLHGDRHFAGLALAHADTTVTVADHRQRGKTEDAAALHDFGHAVDRDHLLAEVVFALFSCRRSFALLLGHTNPRLELQSAFAGCIGQRLDATVIEKTGTVECDLLDAGRLGAFGDELADHRRRFLVRTGLELGTDILFHRGSRGEHLRTATGDDLRIDVRVRPEDRETHCFQFRELGPGFAGTTQTSLFFVHENRPYFFLVSLSTIVSSA